jgi:CheY-like chemotaxis protein
MEPLKLLVVEDEENDYHLVEMALKEGRFPTRVRWVRDGVAAMDYLSAAAPFQDRAQNPAPDLVLLDLKMPRMGGFELLRWLRDNRAHRTLPAIVMSSSPLPEDIRRAYELGATSYFVKPHRFEDFVELLKHLAAYWSYAASPSRLAPAHALV